MATMGEHFFGCVSCWGRTFFIAHILLDRKGYTMGTNTTNKNNKSSTDVIGVISALAGLATAATPLVANAINNAKSKSSDKAEEKFSVAVQKTKQGAVKIFKRSNKVESIEEEVSDE